MADLYPVDNANLVNADDVGLKEEDTVIRSGRMIARRFAARTLIENYSALFCAIPSHRAIEQRAFVMEHIVDPLLADGGRFFARIQRGVLRELSFDDARDVHFVLIRVIQCLRAAKRRSQPILANAAHRESRQWNRTVRGIAYS